MLHGRETGRIIRTAEGQFFEVHEPLDEHERWTPGAARDAGAAAAQAVGRRATASPLRHARMERLRAKVSHFYFKDRVDPVTPAELAAAHHDGADARGAGTSARAASGTAQLHGGADERRDTDAYAPHAHEDGEAARGRPRRGDRPRLADARTPRRPLPACAEGPSRCHRPDGPARSGRRRSSGVARRRPSATRSDAPAWQAGPVLMTPEEFEEAVGDALDAVPPSCWT